ncbi:MAG: serine/threonine protein kinase, partial [Gemmatimonadaceae bacterium]|nr:serine/threonine protein kinase [Gemmatimonadaceae bacterium]
MTEPAADSLFFDVQAALAGEYSLIRELGRGGMGVVYLATEVRLAREVAIKVLPPQLAGDPDLRDQFVREAQVAARLSHPNIVPIHRVGESDMVVYFVMTYVPGMTLGERIRTRGTLTPEQATPLLREVAWALTYAHAAGLVHRDVKPDNILLEQGSGRAMVTDFGIAHAETTTDFAARDGRVVGTAHYMSPEQAMGEPVDGRSDLYSLGVVAYYALSGRFPIDGDTAPQILARHVNHAPEPLRALVPTMPHRLAQAVECCLAKDPAQRYQRANDLADALGTAIEPARDIAAPVRVWLAAEHENRGARVFGLLYGSIAAGSGLAALSGSWIPAVIIPPVMFVLVAMIPTLVNTRRLLRSGYSLDDLRDGLRRHWVRRREEMAYEIQHRWDGGMTPRLIAGVVMGLAVAGIAVSRTSSGGLGVFAWMAGAGAVGVVAIAIVRRVKRRMLTMKEPWLLRFWNSKWGEGMARLASFRLQRAA